MNDSQFFAVFGSGGSSGGGGGSITGSGTTNYVTKWTSSSSLGNSTIQDNGSSVSINAVLDPASQLLIYATSDAKTSTIKSYHSTTNTNGTSIYGIAESVGNGGDNLGLYGLAYNTAGSNIGVYGSAILTAGKKIGVRGYASGTGTGTASIVGGQFISANAGYSITTLVTIDSIAGYFLANSVNVNNCAGYFQAKYNGSQTNYGVYVDVSNSTGNAFGIYQLGGTVTANYLQARLGIGNGYQVDAKLRVETSTDRYGLYLQSIKSATELTYGAYITISGTNTVENVGIYTSVSGNSPSNIGNRINVNSIASGEAYGLDVRVSGNSATVNVGGKFNVTGSGSVKYSLQLEDGTEGAGKFLKCITANGEANWSTISASDIQGGATTGSGTINYVTKWTSSTALGNSLIQDNGTTTSIGASPIADSLLYVTTSTLDYAIQGYNTFNGGIGIYGRGSGNGAIGIYGRGSGNGAIGIKAVASGGSSNYSLQLQDGTQGVNKFLRSIDVNGSSNWSFINYPAQIMSSDMTTGITASANAKAYWIAPTNGTITDIFAYLHTAQTSGAVFTVDIKKNGTSIFSTLITWTNGQRPSNNTDVISTSSFSQGDLFEVIVTQVGDGTAKGLLVTINYNAI